MRNRAFGAIYGNYLVAEGKSGNLNPMFLTCIGSTPQETPIHLLESEQERFVDYLKGLPYCR